MTKSKSTKRALLVSIISMMLCVAMLAGSTFAWFTDSVSIGVNKIVAGNLDVELEYRDADGKWQKVTDETRLFSELEADGVTANLWEPGHTEVVYLKVSNAGTLALKYQFGINIAAEQSGTNVAGDTFRLSDYLVFGQVESATEIQKYTTREDAWTAAGTTLGLTDYTKTNDLLKPGEAEYVALVVYMPTTIGNEANYRGESIPTIDIGVTLFATQTPYESDSFGNDYDKTAEYPISAIVAKNADELKEALSAKAPVILGANVEMPNNVVTFINTENFDLNGQELSAPSLMLYSNGVSQIKNGVITQTKPEGDDFGTYEPALYFWSGDTAILENVTINAYRHDSNNKAAIRIDGYEEGAVVVTLKAGTVVNGEIWVEGSNAILNIEEGVVINGEIMVFDGTVNDNR